MRGLGVDSSCPYAIPLVSKEWHWNDSTVGALEGARSRRWIVKRSYLLVYSRRMRAGGQEWISKRSLG